MLAVTAAAQAPTTAWNQTGGDAAHAGVATFQQGPLDILGWYSVAQPGEATHGLIETAHGLAGFFFEGRVGDLDIDSGACTYVRVPDPAVNASVRIPVDDACPWTPVGQPLYDATTDGVTRCLRGRAEVAGIAMHDAATGAERWRVRAVDLGATPDPQTTWSCGYPALTADGALYVVLNALSVEQPLNGSALGAPGGVLAFFGGSYLAKVRTADGVVEWVNSLDEAERASAPGFLPDPRPEARPTTERFFAIAATLTDTGLLVPGFYQCSCARLGSAATPGGAGVAFQEGGAIWTGLEGDTRGRVRASDPDIGAPGGPASRPLFVSNYAAASGALAAFAFAGDIVVVNPAQSVPEQRAPIPSTAPVSGITGPAWWEGRIVVPLRSSVLGFDAFTLEALWSWTEGPAWDVGRVSIATPSDVYVVAAQIAALGNFTDESDAALVRLSLESGDVLQRLPLPVRSTRGDGRWHAPLLPRTDGSALMPTPEGNVLLFGTPDAALLPQASVSNAYPAPGETVTLQLGGAPEAIVTVSWGEGPLENATGGATLAHRYADDGARMVRATTLYPDGRTATREIALVVGGSPPPTTLLGKAFAPENQDLTFGTLGVLLTLVGFLVALYVRRHRRSVLDEELRRLEALREIAARDPAAGSRELCALRLRFRRDLTEGRLDDSQFSLLEDKLGGVLRGARKRLLVPFVARASVEIRHMLDAALDDGHLTSAEAAEIVGRLPNEANMTEAERAGLAALLRSWRAEEEAAPAAR